MAGARARASQRRRVLERNTCLTWQVHVHARRRGGACLRETPALHGRSTCTRHPAVPSHWSRISGLIDSNLPQVKSPSTDIDRRPQTFPGVGFNAYPQRCRTQQFFGREVISRRSAASGHDRPPLFDRIDLSKIDSLRDCSCAWHALGPQTGHRRVFRATPGQVSHRTRRSCAPNPPQVTCLGL